MAAFKYEKISKQDRINRVEQRLSSLETNHYERRLDLIVSSDEAQSNAVLADIQKIEGDITDLRAEADAVKNETEPTPTQIAKS
jgi:predicted  nucleic acid-binding Zn-ribbon protein